MRDLLIEGLKAPATEEGRDSVLRLLETHLAGPPTVTRVKGTPIPYPSAVAALGRRFDFADAACVLLAAGELDDADVEALAEFLPSYCGIRRQQVLNRLAVGDLAGARAAATDSMAFRDIGAWLADRGDAAEFFGDWKRYEAGRDRHGMADLRRRLVAGVAANAGWRAALAVTGDKRIGPAFARYAFSFVTDLDELRGAVAGVLSELDELSVLAGAVRQASGHNPVRDHPLLGEIVDRIIAVDPTTDKATMRWRDGELFGLWPAYGDQATLDRVRAAVRTPRYRRELTVLARDL